MRLASYHVHTRWCDGKESPEEVVLAAVRLGMTDLGFSAHGAWPFATEWHLKPSSYVAYVAEIRELQRKFRGDIRLACGFEADYLPGITYPDYGIYAPFAPDYLIGSVHYVSPPDTGILAPPWSVDAPTSEVASGLERCFRGDGTAAVRRYWELLREMVKACDFDVVGHLDLPRKRNGELRFFDETAPWYRRELETTLDAVAEAGKIVEVNTGAISRGAMDDLYPSAEALAGLADRGVRIALNSDAHSAQDLTSAYDRAARALKNAGVRELWYLGDKGWEAESLG